MRSIWSWNFQVPGEFSTEMPPKVKLPARESRHSQLCHLTSKANGIEHMFWGEEGGTQDNHELVNSLDDYRWRWHRVLVLEFGVEDVLSVCTGSLQVSEMSVYSLWLCRCSHLTRPHGLKHQWMMLNYLLCFFKIFSFSPWTLLSHCCFLYLSPLIIISGSEPMLLVKMMTQNFNFLL